MPLGKAISYLDRAVHDTCNRRGVESALSLSLYLFGSCSALGHLLACANSRKSTEREIRVSLCSGCDKHYRNSLPKRHNGVVGHQVSGVHLRPLLTLSSDHGTEVVGCGPTATDRKNAHKGTTYP